MTGRLKGIPDGAVEAIFEGRTRDCGSGHQSGPRTYVGRYGDPGFVSLPRLEGVPLGRDVVVEVKITPVRSFEPTPAWDVGVTDEVRFSRHVWRVKATLHEAGGHVNILLGRRNGTRGSEVTTTLSRHSHALIEARPAR